MLRNIVSLLQRLNSSDTQGGAAKLHTSSHTEAAPALTRKSDGRRGPKFARPAAANAAAPNPSPSGSGTPPAAPALYAPRRLSSGAAPPKAESPAWPPAPPSTDATKSAKVHKQREAEQPYRSQHGSRRVVPPRCPPYRHHKPARGCPQTHRQGPCWQSQTSSPQPP